VLSGAHLQLTEKQINICNPNCLLLTNKRKPRGVIF
jgi:hypothetical protein